MKYRCISLYQPWSSLCVIGKKPYETRGRPPIHAVLGQRIAIQAGKQPIQWDRISRDELAAMDSAFGCKNWSSSLSFGAVVGTVRVCGAYRIAEVTDGYARVDSKVGDVRVPACGKIRVDHLGWYHPGRWAWLIDQAESFVEPYPERGWNGWWTWERPSN